MNRLSTSEAARKLGIHPDTLAHYIEAGKVPSPEVVKVGRKIIHMWTEAEIEHVRRLLPKIANGRKIRYQKTKEKQKAQAGVPVPHKGKEPKKKERT